MHRTFRRLSAIIVIAAIAAVHVSAQHRLDLTTIPEKESNVTSLRGLGPSSVTVGGRGRVRLPLEVWLLSMESPALVFQKPVVFEIGIQNTGKSTVLLPWSPEQDRPSPDFYSYDSERQLYVQLVVPEGGQWQRVAGTILFGSERRAGSLLELGPGETATIKASSIANGNPVLRDSLFPADAKPVQITGSISLEVSDTEMAERIVSANTIAGTTRR